MEIVDQEEELSGSIVSFNGRNNTKIKSLIANIEPVQDLHGYNNPWPAGGGVNKFDPDNFSQYYIVNANFNGHEYTEAGTYAIKAYGRGTSAYIYARVKNSDDTWENTTRIVVDETTREAVITITSGQALYVYDAQAHTAAVSQEIFNTWKIQVALASTQPTMYYSYSNICSISGWTGVEVTKTGKNLFDKRVYTNYRIDSSGVIVGGAGTFGMSTYIPVEPGKYYSVQGCGPTQVSIAAFFDADKKVIMSGQFPVPSGTIVAPENAAYIAASFRLENIDTVMIEQSSSVSTYEPYTGNQISVVFPSEAGTIYGGTLTINPDRSADMLVNNAIFEATWGEFQSKTTLASVVRGVLSKNVVVTDRSSATGKYCNIAPYGFDYSKSTVHFYAVPIDNTVSRAYVFLPIGTSDDTLVQVVVPLASPQTYHINNVGQINILLGTNNIWANTGDITVKIVEKGITAFELEPHI